MWSTSLSCLQTLDALNVKKRCGIVYFKWSKFWRYFSFFATLLLHIELSFAQKITDTEYFMVNEGTTISELNLISKEGATIHPFYNENRNLKLNITLNSLVDTKVEEYNITVNRCGPSELEKCTMASEQYTILIKDSYIIIPNTESHSTFLSPRCMYQIEIFHNSFSKYKVNYTIPRISVVSNIEAISFFDEENNGIKLNVSWDIPTEALQPLGYRILISPFNEDKNHCKDAKYEEKITKGNISSVILSKDIIPGCTYAIDIEEDPSNDLTPPRIYYTVADCVGKHCICRYKKKPPAPDITVKQITQDMVKISWKILKDNAMDNITAINFRVYLSQHIRQPVIHVHNITDREVGMEMEENVTVPGMLTGALYVIQAWYSNDSCDSSLTQLDHYAQPDSASNLTYHIMISSMFGLMFVFLLCLLWKRRFSLCISSHWICYRLRGQRADPHPQIRRICRPTLDGAHARSYLAVPIPLEYNNLYVEKEIADLRERGIVDYYEVSYTRLHFEREIGNGAFGQVFLARTTAITGYNDVAVKKLKKSASPEELEEFLLEIAMLKKVGQHPNIVTFLGCCTIRHPYCMVMEYVPCGDLLHYLRALRHQYEQKGKAFLFTVNKNFGVNSNQDRQKFSDCSYITPESIPSNRLPSVTETEYTLLGSEMGAPRTPEAPVTPRTPAVLEYVLDPQELQSFALQIARGMQYLEFKQIVHRDLAARNVLIDQNKTLKISDFGMSRCGIYVNSKHKKVPLRWVSVEAIRDNLYTSKSDVWAYGIVLWEISTLGGFPYPTVADNDILTFLLQGKRLEKPENCTDDLYELMLQCWAHSVDQRPSFAELVEYLEVISSKRRVYVDFNQLNPSYIFPPTEEQTITLNKRKESCQDHRSSLD